MKNQDNFYSGEFKDLMSLNEDDAAPADIHPDAKFGKNVVIGRHVIIDRGCKIGDDVIIGHGSILLQGCVVGNGTQIDHHVLLKADTVIGKGCFIDSYVKSSGHNKIGDGVTLRFNVTICREAVVEDDVFISPNVMMIYSRHTGEKVGGIVIGARSHVGTAAVIGPGVRIVPWCTIGAMSFVNRDCNIPGTYIGIPARRVEK